MQGENQITYGQWNHMINPSYLYSLSIQSALVVYDAGVPSIC